ncbi:MAG: hypothetical protein R3E57_01760 [Porticoccaceae bacterium]
MSDPHRTRAKSTAPHSLGILTPLEVTAISSIADLLPNPEPRLPFPEWKIPQQAGTLTPQNHKQQLKRGLIVFACSEITRNSTKPTQHRIDKRKTCSVINDLIQGDVEMFSPADRLNHRPAASITGARR